MTLSRTQRIALIASGVFSAVAIAVTLVIVAVMLVTRDTRQDINLADLGAGIDVSNPALDEGFSNATDELCSGVRGCTQGYRATHATYRKFTTKEDAAAFASSLRDGYQSNWIVIEYTDDSLTHAEKDDVQHYIDSLATSE